MKLVRAQTGLEEKAREKVDEFFKDTMELFISKFDLDKDRFEIKAGEIAYHADIITEDVVTYLTYSDRKDCVDKIAACVLQIRNEWNNPVYSFFQNLDDF
ncbi:hypothetical protein KY304_01240 [Candidatus Woesearchaeota archaeon]|nr:hypothetical protein [Candidatus Woesearchaeota archaeon]